MEIDKMIICPDCNGSGVYEKFTEIDRCHLHACKRCDGLGDVYYNEKEV